MNLKLTPSQNVILMRGRLEPECLSAYSASVALCSFYISSSITATKNFKRRMVDTALGDKKLSMRTLLTDGESWFQGNTDSD